MEIARCNFFNFPWLKIKCLWSKLNKYSIPVKKLLLKSMLSPIIPWLLIFMTKHKCKPQTQHLRSLQIIASKYFGLNQQHHSSGGRIVCSILCLSRLFNAIHLLNFLLPASSVHCLQAYPWVLARNNSFANHLWLSTTICFVPGKTNCFY